VSLAAGAVAADAAVETELIVCAVGALFTAFLTDYLDTVGAALTAADADILHTEFTDTAVVAEVVFAADTLPAGAAFGTQLLRRTVGAFFITLFTDYLGTLITSVAAGTENLHTLTAFTAFCAVGTVDTLETAFALGAELIVSAVFALFAACHAYDGAVGASVSAVADLLHAVFTQQTFGTVVALAADTVKTDIALNAHLKLGAVGAFFTAVRTDVGTL